jgi:hypothetical protein
MFRYNKCLQPGKITLINQSTVPSQKLLLADQASIHPGDALLKSQGTVLHSNPIRAD